MSFQYPAAEAVKGRVLGALLNGEILTHLDCWKRFGSSRLAHHVHVLRRMGWSIMAEVVTVKTSDAGRQASIAYYALPTCVIAEAGEAGRQYADRCAASELERWLAA